MLVSRETLRGEQKKAEKFLKENHIYNYIIIIGRKT